MQNDKNKHNRSGSKKLSNYEKYSDLLDYALELSETLMLNEKAARGEDVIISLGNGKIERIPAKKILETWDKYMDLLDMPLMKSPEGRTQDSDLSN